jgi:hypothetical protein
MPIRIDAALYRRSWSAVRKNESLLFSFKASPIEKGMMSPANRIPDMELEEQLFHALSRGKWRTYCRPKSIKPLENIPQRIKTTIHLPHEALQFPGTMGIVR